MNANGAHKRRLTATAGLEQVDPAWSPDGRRIVYSGWGSSQAPQIYVSYTNGSNRQLLTHACGACAAYEPSWQPLP